MTAGQKYFFDQDATWHPSKKPTEGLWEEGADNDPNIDLYKVKDKNVSAVHQLYFNVNRGVELTEVWKSLRSFIKFFCLRRYDGGWYTGIPTT